MAHIYATWSTNQMCCSPCSTVAAPWKTMQAVQGSLPAKEKKKKKNNIKKINKKITNSFSSSYFCTRGLLQVENLIKMFNLNKLNTIQNWNS